MAEQLRVKCPVAFCAAVKPSGEWLLVGRVSPPGIGLWSIPGGHIEKNETSAQACRRELNEETGIDAEVLYKGYVDIFTPSCSTIRRCFYFTADTPRGTVRGSSEGEAGWFRFDEKDISPFLILLSPWLRSKCFFRGFILCGRDGDLLSSCILPDGSASDADTIL
ncbi:MAG: NUDIX domain-containing protein [Pyramidobacter sp.]|nr:NUDIX domain-containing protein [Pyramidobacter sp.]